MIERIKIYDVGGPDNDDIQFADNYRVLLQVHAISGDKVAFFLNLNVKDYQASKNITGHTRSMEVQGDPHTMSAADAPRRVEVDRKQYDVSVLFVGSEKRHARSMRFCIFKLSYSENPK